MNLHEGKPLDEIYGAACKGDLAAQILVANGLMDLAPFDEHVIALAEGWFQAVRLANEGAAAYGFVRAHHRRAQIAMRQGNIDQAIKHFGMATALIDALSDEGCHMADRLLEATLTEIRKAGIEDAAIAEAKRVKAEVDNGGL